MIRDAQFPSLATLTITLCAALRISQGATPPWGMDELRAFLDAGEGLTRDEWNKAAKGGSAAKILRPSNPREVAVLGLIRVNAKTPCFLAQFEDIEKFKKGRAVVTVRKIATPPRAADLEAVHLTAEDVAGIRDCHPGRCDLKLPAQAMTRILGEIGNRDAPVLDASAEGAFRRWLVDYLQTYYEAGNAGLVDYDSGSVPVRLGAELKQILDAKPSLADLVPEFYDHLANYPGAHASEVKEFLYWSTEDFGFKPVTSVTHVNIFQQPGQAVIASKQIYATHYFDASLGLTFLMDAPVDGKPGMYLVYLNRSRIDLLSGWLRGMRRFFLRRRMLSGFKDNLRDVADRVGAACIGVDANSVNP